MILLISLSKQLKDDYITLFQDEEQVKELIDDYKGEYKDIVVKEKYERYPKITYPIITIDEITNENVNQYFDGEEHISYLGYQIEIVADQNECYTARENVDRIGEIIDNYMQGERYACMRRIGDFPKAPLYTDNSKMTGYLRYECYVDGKTNTIYRRY